MHRKPGLVCTLNLNPREKSISDIFSSSWTDMTALPPIIALLSISMFALSACGATLAGENYQFCEFPNNFNFR